MKTAPFTFEQSFQEWAEASGLTCICDHRWHKDSLPDHSPTCLCHAGKLIWDLEAEKLHAQIQRSQKPFPKCLIETW